MAIRKIKSESAMTPSEDSPKDRVPAEQQRFRRPLNLKTNADFNRIDESSLFVDLQRRKKDIVVWMTLNVVILLLIYANAFASVTSAWIFRFAQALTAVVCSCNLVYYAFVFVNVRNEAINQQRRIQSCLSPTTSAKSTTKFEYVRYIRRDDAQPSYWSDFQSIFESFKRMTARNRIAFFPDETKRNELVNTPIVEEKSQTDSRNFSETLSKYRGRIITSARDLRQYLTDHKIAEENEFVKTSEDSHSYADHTDFWSGRRRNLSDNCLDVSPLLRRSEYQNSPSSSDSSMSSTKDSGCTNREFFALMRDRHKIESSSFIYWISNFRMWLSKTVLGRIINEINVVDNGLRSLRLSGITIGNVSLETLEDACRNPNTAHQLPSLLYLLPFLRVSIKQHYVVERLRTLSQGSGMGDFKWNQGGDIAGQIWERGCPTDSELLMHLFATYLDQQLPLSPCSSDAAKPFSSNYLADSVAAAKQKKICFVRRSLNPPHYDILIDGELQEIPPGRNNLFYAIVLFLYCVKVYDHGMLGRISLGKHGIDMLWIIDDKGI